MNNHFETIVANIKCYTAVRVTNKPVMEVVSYKFFGLAQWKYVNKKIQ